LELKFSVQTRIQKPVNEVFQAVYDPKKLSSYFTTGGASGPMKEGSTVMWEFADHPGPFPVQIKQVVQDKLIVFEWQASDGDYNTQVRMDFEPLDNSSSLVRISESGWHDSQQGLDSSYGNCGGWMQMSCCMKAYLEYGINLRKGFF
jgi:uncharacterized protein YndB with AHSA1/START domain